MSPCLSCFHSLHALKDESYVRQTLQRQAATLHHAAISYAVRTLLIALSSFTFTNMELGSDTASVNDVNPQIP